MLGTTFHKTAIQLWHWLNVWHIYLYILGKLGFPFLPSDYKPTSRYIELSIGDVQDRTGNIIDNDEAYRIDVKVANANIEIVGKTVAGLLNGGHTLLSLYQYSSEIPEAAIVDYPRFHYRGTYGEYFKLWTFRSVDIISRI